METEKEEKIRRKGLRPLKCSIKQDDEIDVDKKENVKVKEPKKEKSKELMEKKIVYN